MKSPIKDFDVNGLWLLYKYESVQVQNALQHYSMKTPLKRICLVLVDGEQLSKVKIQSDVKKRNKNNIHAPTKTLRKVFRAISPLQLGVHVICFLSKLWETTIKIPDYGSKKHKPNSGQPILKIFKTGNRASLWWFEQRRKRENLALRPSNFFSCCRLTFWYPEHLSLL